jgi:GH25 family lysozyme M1 (1,4-beta-N-acetylmuramidase)
VILGVDVSDWQAGIDWDAVAGAGYSFALIKATEATGNTQSTFAPYRRAIPAAGMGPVGLYHFARPENGNPEAQADHYCDVVGSVGPDEFVVLDIETGDHGYWADFIDRWFVRVEARLGALRSRCVYMSDSPAGSMPAECGGLVLWDAAYGPNTGAVPAWGTGHEAAYHGPFEHSWNVGPWSTWTIWQYSSKGSVPGVGGQVDVNIAPDDLRARLRLTDPAPTPAPPAPIPPLEDDMASDNTLLNHGGGVILRFANGALLTLANDDQVSSELAIKAATLGDVTDDQFATLQRGDPTPPASA